MDQSKYIEVTIFEPATEVPTSDIADENSSKTLNTIHEYDKSNTSRSYFANNMEKNMPPSTSFKPNIRRISSSEQKVDSVSNIDRSLDIDLLLRYYACNSNMEKSINKLFENAEENDFKRPNRMITDKVCRDTIEDPLVELGAVCKICESLKESSSKSALFATFRFHDILSKLRSLIRRSSNKTLEEILSNDPSLTMCKHCGVISYTKPRNTTIEPQKSQPMTSYFLSTKMFSDIESSGDDDPKAYRGGNRFGPRREQSGRPIGKWGNVGKHFNRATYKQHKDSGKIDESRAASLNVKPETDFHSNTMRQVETMIAEREDSNGSEEICVQSNLIRGNRLGMKSDDKNSKITKESSNKEIATITIKNGASERIKVASGIKNKHAMENCTIGRSTSCNCDTSRDKYYSQTDYKAKLNNALSNKPNKWGALMKNHLVADEYAEKFVKDILYETPKSQSDDYKPANDLFLSNKERSDVEQNQATNVFNNTTPPINIMAYLARSHIEPIDKGNHELISHLDNRTYEQSKCCFGNRHSFPGRNSPSSKPYLNSECWIRDKLITSNRTVDDKDKVAKILRKILENDSSYRQSKTNEATKDTEETISATCLMENDSLENCIKGSNILTKSHESNATAFSSSSAENMIREWVNVPPSSEGSSTLDETREGFDTLKPSTPHSGSKFQALLPNERCVYCEQKSIAHHLEGCAARKTWSSALSRNQPKLLQSSERIVSSSVDLNPEIPSRPRPTNGRVKSSNATKGRSDKSRQLAKRLLNTLKRVKRPRSMRTEEKNSSATSTSASSNNSFLGNCFRNVNRRIIYNESSLKSIISKSGRCNELESILLVYRSVLENTEKMDWQSFQRFVEDLHPNQKALWRDICNAIDNEVTRIDGKGAGGTEICIEITSIPLNEVSHEGTRGNEIVFEMDIALGDIQECLARQFPTAERGHLDTLNGASEVIKVQNDDVYYSEVVSNQAE